MKITKELLQKYASGQCTIEEKQELHNWLDQNETITEGFNEEEISLELNRRWLAISRKLNFSEESKVIPLYKKFIPYAAAACFVVAVFFAGRYSVLSNNIAVETNTQESSNLLVYGGNGTCAKVPGDVFSLHFDGQLKLYNGSSSIKTVKVGDVTYSLKPLQTYILMGNNQKSSLIASVGFEDEQSFGGLKGDFSVSVITV